MNIREQIMDIPCPRMASYSDSEFARYRLGFYHAKVKAADIAEAREKELLATLTEHSKHEAMQDNTIMQLHFKIAKLERLLDLALHTEAAPDELQTALNGLYNRLLEAAKEVK